MNKYRKEYCEENGRVKINPENTKLYDYIKHLENKLEQAEQLTLTDVSQQSELLLSAICQFTKRNTQKEIQEVEKWIETDFRK